MTEADPHVGITLRLSQWQALLDRLTVSQPAVPMDGISWIDPAAPQYQSAVAIIRRAVHLRGRSNGS